MRRSFRCLANSVISLGISHVLSYFSSSPHINHFWHKIFHYLQRMGKIDDVLEIFGSGFNKIYPLIMVLYTLLVASNFFDHVIGFFGSWKIFSFQPEVDDTNGFDPSGLIILQKGNCSDHVLIVMQDAIYGFLKFSCTFICVEVYKYSISLYLCVCVLCRANLAGTRTKRGWACYPTGKKL